MLAPILLLLPLLTQTREFSPEDDGLLSHSEGLPIPYDLTEYQAAGRESPAMSLWSSSYIHGSDDHGYMVLSHTINAGTFVAYRGSVLDITNPSRYSMFDVVSNHTTSFYNDNGDLNASFADYGFVSFGSKGNNSVLRTWSSISGVEFDLQFELSSSVLLNGGLGSFPINGSTAYEWSIPAGITTGWLSLNGANITVDTERSLTWYDQQWDAAPPNWTWLQLHVDTGACDKVVTPMSIWHWETASGTTGFATVRESTGVQKVLTVSSLQPSNRTFTSEMSGITYPLDWVLRLGDGTILNISSIRKDQELCDVGALFPAYEGYVKAEGVDKTGRAVKGYGLVEMASGTT